MEKAPDTPELHEVLYISTLAPDAPLKVVSDIAQQSRKANAARDITGLLIFDGMRFCQQIEGPRQDVLALLERIRQDARHVNVELLYDGSLATRRFRRFSLGYTAVDDVDVLERLEHAPPEQALQQFLSLLSLLDMDG